MALGAGQGRLSPCSRRKHVASWTSRRNHQGPKQPACDDRAGEKSGGYLLMDDWFDFAPRMAICEGLLAVRILALETSTNQASVALWESGTLQAEQCIVAERRIARFLLSTVQQVLDEHGWKPKDVQLVAVSQGPGSFTGLRVGLTTAKTFAYARQVPVVGVNTLEVIAEQSFYPLDREATVTTADLTQPLAVVMNAHREQFFAATFASSTPTSCQVMEPTHLVDRESTRFFRCVLPIIGAVRQKRNEQPVDAEFVEKRAVVRVLPGLRGLLQSCCRCQQWYGRLI